MECFVIQFEDGSYWKGQGAKITKELRSASFLRACDVKGSGFDHIKRMAKRNYNLEAPKVVKVVIIIQE